MKRQLLNVGVLLPFTLLSTFFTATTATADLGMNKSNNIYQEIPSTFYQQERIPGEGKEPNINSVTYDGLVVEELSDLLTPEDLATTLVGMGVEVVDVTYKGADIASGIFYGGENIVGFNNGILLTSGSVHNVVGPNTSDNISTDNHTVGDTDLDALSGYTTYDAAVLEIDFIPTTPIVYFRYTFVSDEYNEYVNTTYNDVFAFFINGENCATVEGDPVSINTVNYGNPYTTEPYSHPEYYISNDLSDGGGQLDTEMDGLTHVLTCWSEVNPGQTNSLKLAIADASDHVYDSAVFLEATSLVSDDLIELTGLEVTQAIQDLTDSVVLISYKPTFVRAHVRSLSGTIYNYSARLIGRRNGVALPLSPLQPKNQNARIDILERPSRAALEDSFYFEIPRSWLWGTVEFELTGLGQNISCKDKADTADDCKVTVTFNDVPQPEIRMVGIRWTDEYGVEHYPNSNDIDNVLEDIIAQYPINRLDWDRPYDWNYDGPVPPNLTEVLKDLRLNRLLDGCVTGWPINCERLYYGVLVDYPAGVGADLGLGERPGHVAAGYWVGGDPSVGTHEIGHNLGRQHTLCRGDEGNPGYYPYSNGHISQFDSGDHAFYGISITKNRIFGPSTGDLMGYCRPMWVSDYTYNFLKTAIEMRYGETNNLIQRDIALVTGGEAILINGQVLLDVGAGEIDTILQIDSPADVSAPEPGPYTIQFLDETNNVIAEHDFDVEHVADAVEPTGIFALLLPWPTGVKEIRLLEGATILETRFVSPNSPVVQIINPSSGAIWTGETGTIIWTASDSDGDDLEYTIQYSPDAGATWSTLAIGWTVTSYEVDLNNLPGSAQAQVRVFATDGSNTGQATSGIFSTPRHAPVANIVSPTGNSFCVEEQVVTLSGKANDAEDGTIQDSSLEWSSDIDGSLGFGQSINIECSDLSEGEHSITLLAEDSDGQIGLASFILDVSRLPIVLPMNLDVSPDTAHLIVGQGVFFSPLNIAVRNVGDGTISWSAVSTQGWLSLSAMNGFTPSNIGIRINSSDLPPGTYSGSIEIFGNDALNSPQSIDVTIIVLEYSIFLPLISR